MQAYEVSDGTVKRAITQLRSEGLVETVIGRGVYVVGSQTARRASCVSLVPPSLR